MITVGLWIGAYLLVLALIVNAILQKQQKKKREKECNFLTEMRGTVRGGREQ